ncbi:MAG: hypothetical protein JW963_03740 [Anaerolineales bacterium]|nr:hypothetical protein [Anaerolineales bacterium]
MDELPHSRNPRSILVAGILFLLLLAACLSPPGGLPRPDGSPRPAHPWANALRALDPADAPTPSNDITAVYLRPNGADLQIRIDLLDFQAPKQVSLDVRIGDASVPEAVPLDIHIPSETDSARITLDPLLATVIVEVSLSQLPSNPRVDISTPEDEITGLMLDGPIPTQTAPLLLTFYDTFAARFPAEALRSWDGAHSGPRGERHGLKHLLDAVEEYQVPVVLLDLKEPENLSALDAMGVLPRIKNLANEGLLILPENALKAASSPLGSTTQFSGRDFGFPTSPFSYKSTSTDFQFAFLEENTHLYHPLFSKITYIPIVVETDNTQPIPDGPSLEVRRALLATALNNDKKDLFVLGGNFQETTWGSPDIVGVTMAYFASRPYVHILSAEDLIKFPIRPSNTVIPQHIGQPYPPSQSEREYAKFWAESSSTTSIFQCQLNQSDQSSPNCMLANETYLAIFDSQTASLTYLFTREGDGLHQLIGPSWQVVPGIDLYPGAFSDDKNYEFTIAKDMLVFKSTDETRTKIFTLHETGLKVEYHTQEPVITQIPLLVDPDTRFTPNWAEKYVQLNTPSGVTWGLENGPMIKIQTERPIAIRAFNESLSLLANPEDPDFAYPPGHYVPFPMAIAKVEMQNGYFLRLERLP